MRVLSDTKEGSIDDGGCEKEAYRRSKQPTMAKICYVVQLQRKDSYQNPIQLKVAFIQKAWMNLSFPQTDKPHYFPELEF